MAMERVKISRDLRTLLKVVRTDVARTSQREAAQQAGLSEIWWRQIETGRTEQIPADTLARMFYVIGTTPAQLHNIGEHKLANLIELRESMLNPMNDQMVDYLMQTPDLTDEQREALVTMAKALRVSTASRA